MTQEDSQGNPERYSDGPVEYHLPRSGFLDAAENQAAEAPCAGNGKGDGDKRRWSLDITVPMPMTLTCEATVDGDAIKGSVTAGAFGSFPMEGTRA